MQVPPEPHALVQHLMSSGSLGQSGAEDEEPPLPLQDAVETQIPGVPLAEQGPLTAARVVVVKARRA